MKYWLVGDPTVGHLSSSLFLICTSLLTKKTKNNFTEVCLSSSDPSDNIYPQSLPSNNKVFES